MDQFYFPEIKRLGTLCKTTLLLFMVMIGTAALSQKTAITSGNWSNASTWAPAGVPAADDAVIINPGITVTVDVANAVASTLQINVTGVGLQTSSLVFNAGSQLNVTGMVTLAQVVDRPGTIDMTAGGTFSAAGFSVLAPTGSAFTAGSGTLMLTATNSLPNSLFANLNNLTISGGTTSITGTTTLTGNLNVSSGAIDLTSYTITRSGIEAGSVTLGPNTTLRVGATSGFPNNFNTYSLAPSSTVEFYGISQDVRGTTYGNLVFNGNAKIATGPITVVGTFTSNADFNAGSYTHNIAGDWFNTGNFNASTGTIEFYGAIDQDVPGVTFNNLRNTNTGGLLIANGNITINGTYTSTSIFNLLDMGTYSLSMPVSGVISNAGTIKTQNTSSAPLPVDKDWGTPTTGTVMYNAAAGGQTIVRGTYNNLKVDHSAGGTSTANGDIVIGGTIEASTANTVINLGTYQLTHQVVGGIGGQTNVGIIRTQNTSTLPLPTGRTWGGTVLYDAPGGGQKIVFGTYNDLSIATSGTENTAASIVVNGNLTTSASSVINMNQETISGTFNAAAHAGSIRTQAQTNAFPAGKNWGGTIIYDASGNTAGAQTIIAGNYTNLTISMIRGTDNNLTFPSATIGVSGNLDLSATVEGNGDFILTGNTFNLNGSSNQNVTVTASRTGPSAGPFNFNNVTVSGGGTKTLQTAVRVNGVLNLSNGVVQTTSSNILMLTTNASVTAPSLGTNTSYVQGPIRRAGTTAFTFPVGRAGVYAPISIAAPGAGGDFTAEYFRTQNVGTNMTSPIVRVSPCEYWNVSKTAGASDPVISLSWSSGSNCGSGQYVTDLSSLLVAQWNGSSWVSAGNSATTGTASQGTITSSSSTLAVPYGSVTLASSAALQNPLPVKFTSIRAVVTSTGVQLDWSTATEINVAYYDVERSANAVEFNSIGRTAATANNGGSANYQYVDRNATGSTIFYRIKSVDKDGKIAYSNVVKVNISQREPKLDVYPNPVKGNTISFTAAGLAAGEYSVNMYDMAGRSVYQQKIVVQNNAITQTIQIPAGLHKGTYSIRVLGNGSMLNKTFILE